MRVFVCVCVCVCVCVRVRAWMYLCIYVCICVCIDDLFTSVCLNTCMWHKYSLGSVIEIHYCTKILC